MRVKIGGGGREEEEEEEERDSFPAPVLKKERSLSVGGSGELEELGRKKEQHLKSKKVDNQSKGFKEQ